MRFEERVTGAPAVRFVQIACKRPSLGYVWKRFSPTREERASLDVPPLHSRIERPLPFDKALMLARILSAKGR